VFACWVMVNWLVGILCLALVGCSSSGDDPPHNPGDDLPKPIGPAEPPPEPAFVDCAPEDRTGTYRATFTTVDGNCGDQIGSLVRLDPSAAIPETCAFTFEDAWSDDLCKLERSLLCETPAICSGCSQETIAITEQETNDGSLITGLMTIRVLDYDGTMLCMGTYSVRAQRQ
jgi:hypothetical protein